MYQNKIRVLSRFISSQIRQKSTLPNINLQRPRCGQPTAESHPHLLKPGEVVPCISVSEFQDRRQNLLEAIRNNKEYSNLRSNLIVIPSATKKYMSDKIPYIFRQNSDYLYLSGCMEPDSCLVLTTSQYSTNHYSTLFVRNPDSHSEMWDGPRTSAEAAPQIFGVDQALPISELATFLNYHVISTKNCTLWYNLLGNIQCDTDKIVRELIETASNRVGMVSPKQFIHNMRVFKSPAEIELMKKSCEIASAAINETISICKPDITEHQIFAKVDYECRMNGAEYLAYPPVVAGGERATTIHYINNNQQVFDREMVLMDAGCEYHGYSSDITRTWPINGRFTPQQQLLYEVVHSVQKDLLEQLISFPTLDNLFDNMCMLLGKKLQEVGLISRQVPPELATKAAYEFCPHHVSHYLGMDVHDTNLVSRDTRLQPGMIITIEPGIYITDRHKVPAEYQGIGIRIEDDVLITENGPLVLTQTCVKDIDDIENLMNKKQNL